MPSQFYNNSLKLNSRPTNNKKLQTNYQLSFRLLDEEELLRSAPTAALQRNGRLLSSGKKSSLSTIFVYSKVTEDVSPHIEILHIFK